MTLGSELELKNSKKLGEEKIVKKQSKDLFRKSHGVLGLLDLPLAWWFSKTYLFCMSGHLSVHLSPDIYIYIYIRFFWLFPCGQKYTKIKAHICWKRHNKRWTFRFFEKFYLNLLEIIFNESSFNFRFLIENPTHIYIYIFREITDFDILPKDALNQLKCSIF